MRPHDTVQISKAIELLKVLAHPLRLSLLCHIHKAGEISAGELVALEEKHASQSHISQYLAQLKRAKLVHTRREGKFVYYALHAPVAKDVLATLARHYCRS